MKQKRQQKTKRFRDALPANLYQQVTAVHPYRFPRHDGATGDGDVTIDAGWRLALDGSCGPLARRAADDLVALLRRTFGVKIRRAIRGDGPAIDVRVEADRAGAAPESYTSQIDAAHGVRIVASDDEGAMRALFHLGRSMLNRRAPVLPIGRESRRPQWALRIASPVLHRSLDEPADYLDLPESYLMNMARYGYNATYLYMSWYDFMRPQTGGALVRPGWKQRIADLRRASEYLMQFGIRLLFHVNLLPLSTNHRAFQERPSIRGAQTFGDGLHCLCSSSPEVLAMIRRSARELFEDVPLLAGGVLIVGGECYLHCYTRPHPKPASGTNCPRCGRLSPDDVVAGVANAFAEGALAARGDAHVLVWPYSAFSWGDAAVQASMLRKLHPEVSTLTAFEKDDWLRIEGTGSYVFDYSITALGPSPLFRKLQSATEQAGRTMLAKTESSQSIEMFNVPRIPVMNRWAERFSRLRQAGLGGVHTAWRFYGFCAQRTDEVVDYFNWMPRPDTEQLLRTMAERDFGPAAAGNVLGAWRAFSDAFGKFPYGGGITGFPYFRGPFFLGAAHPLVFDLTSPIQLSSRFWSVDPSAVEAGFEVSELLDLPRQPNFFVDLTWTQPFGADIVDRRLAEIDRQWQRGLALLERARAAARGDDRARLDDERSVSRMIGCMFRTASHLVRFQRLRHRVTGDACTPKRLRATCVAAMDLVVAEIENATVALDLVRDNPSLGYGATYGYAFDAELIADKVRHAREELRVSIPRFYSQHAFHCFGLFETLAPTEAQVRRSGAGTSAR